MQTGFLNFYDAVLGATQQRASLLANNIANADTPGFKAMDIPFDNALSAALSGATTSPEYRANTPVGLDGNDVSLDLERVEAVQNGEQMTAAATFLRQSTADMITALRPNPNGS
jgi:flagellar basal-body rod protein FlgB